MMFAKQLLVNSVKVAAKTAFKPAPLMGIRGMATKFAKSHEYVKVDGEIGTIGITSHAADALGDIVYVELPEVGDEVTSGESFGSVESVKAASDVYSPVSGEVVEVNSDLEGNPGEINKSAMDGGWFMKVKVIFSQPFFLSLSSILKLLRIHFCSRFVHFI